MEGFLSELDRYLFGNGRHYKIYEKMGAHPACFEGQEGIHFAVWAPHAKRVSIVCDRNGWDPERNPMLPLESTGIYEGFYPGMGVGELYKCYFDRGRGMDFQGRPLCLCRRIQTGNRLYYSRPFRFSLGRRKMDGGAKEKKSGRIPPVRV